MSEIKNRYDFIYLFEVCDGNPNGDPDQLNLPRIDAEDQHGIVTDVCIKRKVRNYVTLKYNLKEPYDIFIRQEHYLNSVIDNANGNDIKSRQMDLCKRFYDIRTFGAVLSTGKNAGTVRGPVQLTFARSIDPIFQADHSITRCAVATEKEAKNQENREYASTFGRKATVPYGLYKMYGFISAIDAAKSGFNSDDLKLFWEALINCFEHDRSAARGFMAPVKLIVFKHNSHLGNELASNLFEKVKINKLVELPRSKADYKIEIDKSGINNNIEVIVWPDEKEKLF